MLRFVITTYRNNKYFYEQNRPLTGKDKRKLEEKNNILIKEIRYMI